MSNIKPLRSFYVTFVNFFLKDIIKGQSNNVVIKTTIRIIPHLLFWMSFLVLIIGSKRNVDSYLLFTWLTILSVSACVVYINLYLILPRLLLQKKYFLYFISLSANILTGSLLLHILAELHAFSIEIRFIDSVKNLLVFVIITSSIKFFRETFRKQVLIAELQQKQLETENAILKLQINPHFLFNTLNNLYALNLENNQRANEMILQLSDFLRYQLEVSDKSMISLSEELKVAETYINLEKIRVYKAEIEFTKSGSTEGVQFPPLLLLPIIENAFKFGSNIFRFCAKYENGSFTFESYNQKKKNIEQLKGKGLGLNNVQKRLDLVYGKDSAISIRESETDYQVNLSIKKLRTY